MEVIEIEDYIQIDNRKTTNFMNAFEKAAILAMRAKQIDKKKKQPYVKSSYVDPLFIAQEELNTKRIPLAIRRYLPDGNFEDWTVDELIIK